MEESKKEPTIRVPLQLTDAQIWIAAIFGAAFAFLLGWAFVTLADPTSLYGAGFFICLPIISGMGSAMIFGRNSIPTGKQSIRISLMTYVLVSLVILVIGREGVICMLMAAPIAIPSLMLGSRAGANIYIATHKKYFHPSTYSFLGLLPILTIGSATLKLEPLRRSESTELIIHADPERIWPLLFKLDKVGGPVWLPFQAGVAHPTSISCAGQFVGARRDCELSTGDMVERVTTVEKNRLMRFDVMETPPTMKELNPFWDVKSAHLSGYFMCTLGEFKLEPLPGGKTKLIGTSWYEHRIYPAFYWNLWTDSIVEHVHTVVMNEIKRRAEIRK